MTDCRHPIPLMWPRLPELVSTLVTLSVRDERTLLKGV